MRLCIETNDFSYFDARAKLQEKVPDLYANHFHKLVADPQSYAKLASMQVSTSDAPPQGDAELGRISKGSAEQLETKVNAAKQELENEAKNAPKDNAGVAPWKDRLRAANKKHKEDIAAVLDKSTEDAMARIEKLPEAQQDQAADQWTAAQDWIMGAFKKVLEFLSKAWDAVVSAWNSAVEWVKGVIKKVEEWASEAGRAIEGAIKKLTNLFG